MGSFWDCSGHNRRLKDLETKAVSLKKEIADLTEKVNQLTAPVVEPLPPPVVVEPPPPVVVEPPPPVVVTPTRKVLLSEDWSKDLSKWVLEGPTGQIKIVDKKLVCIFNTEQAPNHNGKYKSEVYPRDLNVTTWTKFRDEPRGVPLEYSASILLDKCYNGTTEYEWAANGGRVLLMQVHGYEDKGETGRNPALALSIETKGGKPSLVWRGSWHADAIQVGNPNTTDLWVGAPVTKKWINVKVSVLWSFQEDGRLKIEHTVDGVTTTVVDKTGPNCFNDKYGPYWIFGLYQPTLSSAEYAYQVKRPRIYEAQYGPVLFEQIS